jgi:hypothetical protein
MLAREQGVPDRIELFDVVSGFWHAAYRWFGD